MINSILEAILWLFVQLCQFVSSILLMPIWVAISAIFPDLSSFIGQVYTFINQYILHYLGFAKEVFLNVTGFPREFFNAMVIFFMGKLTYMAVKRSIKFIINIYRTIKGSIPYESVSSIQDKNVYDK